MTDRTEGARRRWRARLPVGIGVLLVLVSAGLFAVVPLAEASNRAYAGASACPAGTRSASCTTTAPAVVKGAVYEHSGKSVRYWLLLTERGTGIARRVRMPRPSPVFDAVHAGDTVALTYWRGEVRAVRFGAATQEAWTSPADDGRLPAALGFVALPFGLGALLLGRWRRRHPSTAAHAAPWQLTAALVVLLVLGVLGATTSFLADAVRDAFLLVAGAAVPVALLAVLFARWMAGRMRRAADTSDIVPVPPTGRRCVRASVYGDVPYSVAGFDHLVVGDGRPAATPDPDGRVARRTLPETLTVRCVRSLGPDDPAFWPTAYKYDCAVIECRDGDRTVLIAGRRRDAALILGALTTAVPG
ncbi:MULTISPECIES: hypothetical protein [Streptomyces]|uniref:hypothetical protein n=1 Tax=Streptomyces TaxID=1883 RepID=UPI001962EB0F|nr:MULTISPECIES: hypothetical protein [Streptomyces]QRX95714.1 hypothetical protein JNO44_37445 [Streptomyces noursei]UJB45441.1 hypothetical protein HRD51_35830 [Streptomyces sp. A1-5]